MADLRDFLPIRPEDLSTIRPRVDADANAGIDPTSDLYIDQTPGGFYWDLTQAVLLEVERLWDFANVEVPAVAFLSYAWGDFLDRHGEGLQTPRNPALRATGVVRFLGTDGTLIGTGVQVSTQQIDPDTDPITVETTSSGTISGGFVDLNAQAIEEGVLGNAPSGSLVVLATGVPGVTSVTNINPFSNGSDVESDESYRRRLELASEEDQGGGNVSDYKRWFLDEPGVGFVFVEANWQGPGTIRVIATDPANNPLSPAFIAALQDKWDPPTASTTLNGNQAMNGTTITVASTAGFPTPFASNPTPAFYWNGQRLTYTGKTGTTFTGVTGGSGSGISGDAITLIGQGAGDAPVGHEVVVQTPVLVTIPVAATVTHASGYTLDGTGGTVATRASIIAALADYIDNLAPGEDVVLEHAQAQFFTVEGIYDLAGVTLSGSAANKAIGSLEVAQLGAVTLT